MSLPRIAADVALAFDTESIEEHDRHENPLVPRGHDTLSQAVKVSRIQAGQIKLGLAVQCGARPQALISRRFVVDRSLFRAGIHRTLPGPQAEKIVMMLH